MIEPYCYVRTSFCKERHIALEHIGIEEAYDLYIERGQMDRLWRMVWEVEGG